MALLIKEAKSEHRADIAKTGRPFKPSARRLIIRLARSALIVQVPMSTCLPAPRAVLVLPNVFSAQL